MKSEIKDSEDIHQKTEDLLKKIQQQIKLTDDVLNSSSYRKSTTFVSNRPRINVQQNIVKIKDSSLEFVNIDEDFKTKPKDSFFDDICSICSKKIYYERYICIICKNCIICPNCELNHLHPVIKWKNNQLSTLNSIFLFISNNNKSIQNLKLNNNYGFFGSNRPKYILKLESIVSEFIMKPKEKLEIPINIINVNKFNIDFKKLKIVLFARNIKDLIIFNKEIENKLGRGEILKTSFTIESNIYCKTYNFSIGLFSTENIDIEFNDLSFKIKVFIDREEEELNSKFRNFPQIIKENKKIKKSIKTIMENDKIKQDPLTILKVLKQKNLDIQDTLKNLLSNNNH